jgi:hypothetical protein
MQWQACRSGGNGCTLLTSWWVLRLLVCRRDDAVGLVQVLKTLIATAVAFSTDKGLGAEAEAFSSGVCCHFAMLFATGVPAPPPALPTSVTIDPTGGGNSTPGPIPISLRELDLHLFLDAIVEVCGKWATRV